MIESLYFDEKNYRQYDNKFRDNADRDSTTSLFEAVMNLMDNYKQNSGATNKHAQFESAAAINAMKMEAPAKLRAEQETFANSRRSKATSSLII